MSDKKYTIHPIAHSHTDMNWLWPWEETIEVFRLSWENMLSFMDKYPWFVFLQSQPCVYEAFAPLYPEIFEKIQPHINSGNWCLAGGNWDESDTNMPRGEALARSILLGKQYFQTQFGVDIKMGWLPDSFGHSWQMPQILKLSELDYHFYFRCKRGVPIFWWEGPDGSRILVFEWGHYNGSVERNSLEKNVRKFEEAGGGNRFLFIYGKGDHGGYPNEDELKLMEELQEDPDFPARFEFTTIEEYFQLVQDERSDIPVLIDEINFAFEGCYTTHADIKRINRESENLLLTAEVWCTVANVSMKVPYPGELLRRAWKYSCFHQFHDILNGCSIASTFTEARSKFAAIKGIADSERDRAIQVIARDINTEDVKGMPIVVFNPLSFGSTDVVQVKMPAHLLPQGNLMVTDPETCSSPVQVSDSGAPNRDAVLWFIAHDVPSVGYKTYSLSVTGDIPSDGPIATDDGYMENQFFSARLDMDTGGLTSLKLKANGYELVPEGEQINTLLLQNEDPEARMSAWHLQPVGDAWTLKAESVELVEHGPVRCVYRIIHRYQNSTFTRYLVFYPDLPRLDVQVTADWHEHNLYMRAMFPTSLQKGTAVFNVPYGAKERPADGHEVPAIQWFDLSSGGVGLSLLNNVKYGCNVDGGMLSISLLRNPHDPDPNPDEGWHEFCYSIYPHAGDWKSAESMRHGAQLNQPLLAYVKRDVKSGKRARVFSFVRIEPENLLVTAFKQAERSSDCILRFVESWGEDVEATVTFPSAIESATVVNLLENQMDAGVSVEGKQLRLRVKPYQIKSLQVALRRS